MGARDDPRIRAIGVPYEGAAGAAEAGAAVSMAEIEHPKAQGSTDEYCSVWPEDGHDYVSHGTSVQLWIRICSSCGHIDNADLSEQLASTYRLVGDR